MAQEIKTQKALKMLCDIVCNTYNNRAYHVHLIRAAEDEARVNQVEATREVLQDFQD